MIPLSEALTSLSAGIGRRGTVRASQSDGALRSRCKVINSAEYATASTSPPRPRPTHARANTHQGYGQYAYARGPSTQSSLDLDLIEERWEGGTRSTAFYSARSSMVSSSAHESYHTASGANAF